MDTGENKENADPKETPEYQEVHCHYKKRMLETSNVTPANKVMLDQSANAPTRELPPLKKMKLNFKPRKLNFSSAGENAEAEPSESAQVLTKDRTGPVTPEKVCETYVHQDTPRYRQTVQEIKDGIKKRSQTLQEEEDKLKLKITEKLQAIRISTEKRKEALEEGEIDEKEDRNKDKENKENKNTELERGMESMKISTLRFHRQNTVVRVRYSEREIFSDNRCQAQPVELEERRNTECHARDDEPEEIITRLEQQVRDLLSIMETKLYWPTHSKPEDDHNIINGLENILHMELRLFQRVLSLKGEIRRLQRAQISGVLSAQDTL